MIFIVGFYLFTNFIIYDKIIRLVNYGRFLK